MMNTIIIPNLDATYLTGFNHAVLTQLKKLTDGCPYNTIKNPVTGNCVLIKGLVGKKIIKELVATYPETQLSAKKSCAVPTYPIVKKPTTTKSQKPLNLTNITNVKCSNKSKFANDSQYVCNPITGAWIKKDGPTYKKLAHLFPV